MKRRNATRSALFTSIISLLLCVSMLVGTTFAWFTDSVESGRNTIAAGNLDVELYANGNPVDGTTELFNDVDPDLWEPGAVAYENLLVKNVGSLALQYTLTLDVLEETVVNGYKLSDVIMVGVVDEKITSTDRNEVIGKVTTWTKLSNFKFGMNALKLEAGHDSGDFAVVLYWAPNDNELDNRYNMNNENKGEVLKLEIGVSLVATQVVHESDSFGDDYDEEATPWIGAINTDWYFENLDATEFTIDTVDELAGLAAIVNGTATAPVTTFAAEGATTVQDSFKNKTITLGSDIDLANATWTPIGNSTYSFKGIFDGNENTISNLKVTGRGKNVGLFGFTTDGEIKNLTVENASVTGYLNVGVVAGTPYTSKYTNITVTGHVEVNGMSYVGGVGGKNAYANWDMITVNVDETSYVKADSVENGTAYRTYVGGVVGFNGEGGHSFTNITSNIDVIGSTCDVGGAFGIAHYGNKFENVTVTGDVTITNATEAADAEEIGGIAGVWNNGGSDVTFTNCKFKGELTANIEGVDLSNNTITGNPYGTGNGRLIIDGKVAFVVASNAAGLQNALKDGVENIDANGANLGNLNYGLDTTTVPEGKTVTISNATFEGKSYGNGVDGTVIFENCTFTNTGAYSIHFDNGKGDVIFKNCTLYGWNSFGSTLNSVSFYDCTLYGNGTYALIRSYVDLHVENCLIDTTNANHNDVYSEGVEAVAGATLTESNNTYVVATAAALQAAIANGSDVALANDITVDKWIMFSETLNIGDGSIITIKMDGLTIDGKGHTLTVNAIESAGNGNSLFHSASNLNISNLTIKYADGLAGGGIGLNSGVISNVNFVGGDVAVFPGNGDITIENCTFATNATAIYFEEERDNLTVTGCTFNQPDAINVILLRGDVTFTNNSVNSGRTVNIVSGSPVVTGNNFTNVRLKVYSVATATISNNTINNLAFEDNATTYSSSFADNTLSAEAQAALAAMTKN